MMIRTKHAMRTITATISASQDGTVNWRTSNYSALTVLLVVERGNKSKAKQHACLHARFSRM
eukprot:scaffold44391_cov18-Prasinocladus_malaysianus.AAC.2